jgi:hypothetical protein
VCVRVCVCVCVCVCVNICTDRGRARERARESEGYQGPSLVEAMCQCQIVTRLHVFFYLPGATNSGAKSGGGNRFAEAASATSRFGAPPFRSLLLLY